MNGIEKNPSGILAVVVAVILTVIIHVGTRIPAIENNFIYSRANVYKTKDRLSMDIGWLKFPGTKDGAVFDLQKLGVYGAKNGLKKALTSPPRKALKAEFWGEDGKTSRMIDGVAALVSLLLSWALIAGLRSARGEYRYSKNNHLTER